MFGRVFVELVKVGFIEFSVSDVIVVVISVFFNCLNIIFVL